MPTGLLHGYPASCQQTDRIQRTYRGIEGGEGAVGHRSSVLEVKVIMGKGYVEVKRADVDKDLRIGLQACNVPLCVPS